MDRESLQRNQKLRNDYVIALFELCDGIGNREVPSKDIAKRMGISEELGGEIAQYWHAKGTIRWVSFTTVWIPGDRIDEVEMLMDESYRDRERRVLQAIYDLAKGQPNVWVVIADLTSHLSMPSQTLYPIINDLERRKGLIDSVDEAVWLVPDGIEMIESTQNPTSSITQNSLVGNSIMQKPTVDARKVLVVHGRNLEARDALFTFLRSIDLRPIEWSEAVKATGKGSPYVGEVLEAAFSMAQAVVVLMTPDDEAKVAPEFLLDDDPDSERMLTGQCRPNVLFEAGMAMGRSADQTILIELGKLRAFSDIGGRHTLKFDDGPTKRRELADRLMNARCAADLGGSDWITAGDFASVIEDIKKKRNDAADSVDRDPVLTPVISFNCTRPPNHSDDQCSLQIRFVNTSERTIRDFRIDMWFPNSFLNQNTSFGNEVVEKRTETHRLFRVLPSFNRFEPLYPGDSIQPSLSYEVTDEQKGGVGLDEIFSIQVYVDDELTMNLEKEMTEFVIKG